MLQRRRENDANYDQNVLLSAMKRTALINTASYHGIEPTMESLREAVDKQDEERAAREKAAREEEARRQRELAEAIEIEEVGNKSCWETIRCKR